MKSNITIRFYTPKDFEAVISLLKEAEMDVSYSPHDFGTKSMVAERNGEIVGFCWAICGDSPIIYLNDLVIIKKYQYKPSSKHPAPPLLNAMVGLLKKLGYKRAITNIQPERKKVLKMAIEKLGFQNYGKQNLVGVNLDELLTKIQNI